MKHGVEMAEAMGQDSRFNNHSQYHLLAQARLDNELYQKMYWAHLENHFMGNRRASIRRWLRDAEGITGYHARRNMEGFEIWCSEVDIRYGKAKQSLSF